MQTAETFMNWQAESLWLRLVALLPGLSVEVLPSAGSTNTTLLDRARQGADTQPCLLVAQTQTQGRGRMGRAWHSAEGASLTFSLSLPLSPGDWSGLSLAVGLALADALDPPVEGSAPRIGLKWPNDLWLIDGPGQGRKLGGILIETVATRGERVAVVGVGLNVQPLTAWSGAADAATSDWSQGHASLSEIDCGIDAPTALARVAEPLLRALLRFQAVGFAPLVPLYARRDVLRGQPVTTVRPATPTTSALASEPDHDLDNWADGVDDQGALLLRQADGVSRMLSGEVSVRVRRTAGKGA